MNLADPPGWHRAAVGHAGGGWGRRWHPGGPARTLAVPAGSPVAVGRSGAGWAQASPPGPRPRCA